MKSPTYNINDRLRCCMALGSPVSAKAAKGTACLSLLSDSSATATRPLTCSSWLGRWIDWQADTNTPPISLQSSNLAQSCRTEKRQRERPDVSHGTEGADRAASRPPPPPQREPHSGTPDTGRGQLLFNDTHRIDQPRWFWT